MADKNLAITSRKPCGPKRPDVSFNLGENAKAKGGKGANYFKAKHAGGRVASRFSANAAPRFGIPAPGSPRPHVGKVMSRRLAMLRRAEATVMTLAGPGESMLCPMTGYSDPMHVLVRLIEKRGPCRSFRIATLSFNAQDLAELRGCSMARWSPGCRCSALTVTAANRR